jgi:hypothetical protein
VVDLSGIEPVMAPSAFDDQAERETVTLAPLPPYPPSLVGAPVPTRHAATSKHPATSGVPWASFPCAM